MAFVTCSICGDVFEVADELLGDDADAGGKRSPIYICGLHEEPAASDDEADCCPVCGKNYYDFSDMGCGYCDRRSPDWGVLL